MSLSPRCPYHPARVPCRIGQPAPCHAAFAPKERARPPDLSFVSRPPVGLLSLRPGALSTIPLKCFFWRLSRAFFSPPMKPTHKTILKEGEQVTGPQRK